MYYMYSTEGVGGRVEAGWIISTGYSWDQPPLYLFFFPRWPFLILPFSPSCAPPPGLSVRFHVTDVWWSSALVCVCVWIWVKEGHCEPLLGGWRGEGGARRWDLLCDDSAYPSGGLRTTSSTLLNAVLRRRSTLLLGIYALRTTTIPLNPSGRISRHLF